MKRFLTMLAALVAAFACGDKNDPVDPTPAAPTSLTVSKTSFEIAQTGETVSIDITSPARPVLSGRPDWIAFKDGTYKDYKMTVQLVVSANESMMIRTAEMSFMATGVTPVKVTVTQQGKEAPEPPTPTPGGDNDAWKMAAKLGLGWNMGNHFDGYYNGSWAGANEGYPNETIWQPGETEAQRAMHKATQATFTNLKRAGFTSVRIPVSWLKMIGPAPEYKIDEAWLNRVYEVVGFAHNAGLNVIVNTHHDENHGVSNTYQWLDIKNAANNAKLNTTIKAEIQAVWTQIATKFKDCGDWLILESFNELNDGGWGWSSEFRADPTRQCNILNEWNQVFVNAVRATGGENATRWLGVPTYAANPEFEKYFTMPSDPAGKMMLAVHFYDPSNYTIGDNQWSDWGHTGAAGKKETWGDEDHVQTVFGNLRTKYVDKNVPVYLGEFGCSMRNKNDNRAWRFYLYYLEYVVKAAKTYGMSCFLWDNGAEGYGKERHGYINHGTGAYLGNSKEAIDVMVKAMTTPDSGYTLQSVYDKAPKF